MSSSGSSCPFCEVPEADVLVGNALAFCRYDKFPVNPGHVLVIPRRHVATWFDASLEEQRAIMELVTEVRERIEAKHSPAGYNIGVNVGEAAGQTVMHLHVHLIPRFLGDVEDPRGGVRYVVPARANYLSDS